ncbi:zinc finger protein ztf-16 [Parasteatoda tepidariorum]|nr:zinc finger and BTB domain-containing protein 24 [Parasteatoda tepidariorum]XP_042909919.1 zinc finger and BTB domain-containing protein 24 [Parasteatoda tepidariorum]
MEKSLLNEPSTMNDSPLDQIDSDGNERIQCSSPERQITENTNSSTIESQIEGKKPDNMNIEANEGQPVREAVDVQDSVGLIHHTQINGPIILENSESAFLCKYPGCNFTTVNAELYLKHEDSHVDIGAVSCDACGMTFRTYANMRRHHLYVHQGIRTFECQYCSKRFLRKEQFVEHLAKHTKPRPYHCTFCGETFNFRGHLKTHLSTEHAGIVVGKTCHLCNFKASSPNAIKVHYATFHLKQNMDVPGIDIDRMRDLCGNSHILNSHHENGAIDLATVSQNFSFMNSHFPIYSLSGNENNIAMPGPSDLSCRTKVIRRATSPVPNIQNLTAAVNEPAKEDDNRHTCVTSLAGSTVISPPTCQDGACQRMEMRIRQRMCIKPEPPELTVDDSQNSSVQPTSTMDLSTNEVVETTCNSHETLCRRKVHKHSSSDDTGSESHNSPSNRLCVDSQQVGRTPHTCFRYRPYDEGSSQRCREFSRHTCVAHSHPERRARFSDSDIERSAHNEQSDGEERKIFYSRATSTNNAIVPGDRIDASRSNLATTFNTEGSTFTTAPSSISNYFGRKNIVIRDIESCTLTCTFCGIIFPDQTLYLLHRSLHSDNSPWKCNLCGKICSDKYDFNSHIISKGHY